MANAPVETPVQDGNGKINTAWSLWFVEVLSKSGNSLSTYADNTAAKAGGLKAGSIYKTSTGQVMVVY